MRYAGFLTGLTAFLVLFYPLFVDSNHVLLFRDISLTFLPAKAFFWDSWRVYGEFPLWNPFADGGYSYLGDLTGSPLHPLNYFLLLFPRESLPWAFSLWLGVHVAVFAGGVFAYLRSLGCTLFVASVTALSLAWSGPTISIIYDAHMLASFSFLPWTLYFVDRWMKTKNALMLFAVAASLALSFLGGDPQQVYVTFLFLPFLVFRRLHPRTSAFAYLTMCILFLLLVWPQLQPVWEQLRSSTREQLPTIVATQHAWSFHPARLLEWILPHAYGHVRGFENFSGSHLTNTTLWGFYIWDAHLGYFVILAFIASAFTDGKRVFFANRLWLFGATFFLLASFGDWSRVPIYDTLELVLPFWSKFRYPERLQIFTAFFLHVAAARALGANVSPVLKIALSALALMQGAYFARSTLVFQPLAITEPPESIQKLVSDENTHPFAGFLSLNPLKPVPGREESTLEQVTRKEWRALAGNLPGYFGIVDVNGYLSLRNAARTELYVNLTVSDPKRLVDYFGARYLLDNVREKVFLNNEARDRVRFEAKAGAPKIVRMTEAPRSLEVELEPGAATTLFWNQNWHPAWRLAVDGASIAVEKIDGWSIGAIIPAGAKTVNFWFSPRAFFISLLAPIVYVLLLLFFTFRSRVLRRLP